MSGPSLCSVGIWTRVARLSRQPSSLAWRPTFSSSSRWVSGIVAFLTLQSNQGGHLESLVFLWAKLIAYDDSRKPDLVRESQHMKMVEVLKDPEMVRQPWWHGGFLTCLTHQVSSPILVAMAAFVLQTVANDVGLNRIVLSAFMWLQFFKLDYHCYARYSLHCVADNVVSPRSTCSCGNWGRRGSLLSHYGQCFDFVVFEPCTDSCWHFD